MITGCIAILISLLLLIANVYYRQQIQFRQGEAGRIKGDFMVALTGYESAIRMYLPFSDNVSLAARRIWELGENAEKKGRTDQALAAYRSLRSSYYAGRWLRQPGKEWIERCDLKISALMKSDKKMDE